MTEQNETENPNYEEKKTTLLAYIRKSKSGRALNISFKKEALENARTYTSSTTGEEMVTATVSLNNILEVINGTKDVTSISQFLDDSTPQN